MKKEVVLGRLKTVKVVKLQKNVSVMYRYNNIVKCFIVKSVFYILF